MNSKLFITAVQNTSKASVIVCIKNSACASLFYLLFGVFFTSEINASLFIIC